MVDLMNCKQLRYRISDWSQLPQTLSNNSTQLKIGVSDINNPPELTGTRIQVRHQTLGVLSSYVVNAQGDMITELDLNVTYELTTEQILAELAKWGFDITYVPKLSLPDRQVEYLTTLKGLEFDKIRILTVYDHANLTAESHWYVIGFNAKQNPYWLNNMYAVRREEFYKSLNNGSAINITGISDTNNWSWSWLAGKVLSIDDILTDRIVTNPTAPTTDDEADTANGTSQQNPVYLDPDCKGCECCG
jgi:hypothetical protein